MFTKTVLLNTSIVLFFTTIAFLVAWLRSLRDIKRIKAYDTVKTEFFADITHELKTPISIILSAIQLMDRHKTDYNRDLLIMKRNCYRLLKLANNLLDYTKIERGCCTLEPENCNMSDFLCDVLGSIKPYAEQKNILLIYEAPRSEIFALIDREKFERVMLNLLSNAIKFTNPGGRITTTLSQDEENIVIKVRDTGIGIPKEKKEYIFDRFAQVGVHSSSKNEGSGIGLSLVKAFVQLHGGKIKVDSELGKGSEFTIALPKKNPRLEKLVNSSEKNARRYNPANEYMSAKNTGNAEYAGSCNDMNETGDLIRIELSDSVNI